MIVVVANVEAIMSGWFLRITRDGATYNASLAGPGGSDGMDLRRWPSVERIFESIESYLRGRDLAHVWIALHVNAVAEMRS